jgi:hypothetical protein
MTIEGVAGSPTFVNSPCVSCSKLTAPAWNEAETAAYNTLHGPVAIATMLPKFGDGPE